ncbi:hypothetical protein EV122DRAFT_202556 [Schizophyllum commune]
MMTSADEMQRHLGAGDVHALQFIATTVAVDFSLYGLQAALSITAVILLARKEGRSYFTLAAVLGLFLSSTISTAGLALYYFLQLPFPPEPAVVELLLRLNILISVAHFLNYVLSDTVLVWRAWCLWPDNRLAQGILSLCISGSIVGATAECAWLYWPGLATLDKMESVAQMLTRLIPLLVTNVVATALIGAKYLKYRRDIKSALSTFTQKSQAETVLLLLLESGVAYVSFWIVIGVLETAKGGNPFSGLHVFTSVSHHIAGIYPTCVLFTSLQSGTAQSLLSSRMSQAMRFTGSSEAHDGARTETVQALDSGIEYIDSAHDIELQDSRAEGQIPDPPLARSGEAGPVSSEGIAEVEKLSTAM